MTALPVLLSATDQSLAKDDEIPSDIIISGNPTATLWFGPPLEGSRDMSFGIWSGEPGAMASDSYPYDEIFVVTEGAVRLDSADGSVLEVNSGQTGLIPAGWRGVWHTLAPTKKTYIIAAQPTSEVPTW